MGDGAGRLPGGGGVGVLPRLTPGLGSGVGTGFAPGLGGGVGTGSRPGLCKSEVVVLVQRLYSQSSENLHRGILTQPKHFQQGVIRSDLGNCNNSEQVGERNFLCI